MRFSYTKEKEDYAQESGRYVWGDLLCAQQRLDFRTLLERSPRNANEGSKPFHSAQRARGSGLLRTSVSYHAHHSMSSPQKQPVGDNKDDRTATQVKRINPGTRYHSLRVHP